MDSTNTYYEWLFRKTPVMAGALDAGGLFVDVSDALAERLGFTPAELMGQGPLDIATPHSAARIETEYRPLLRRCGFLSRVPVEFVTRRGSVLQFLASSIVAADGAGQSPHTMSVFTEIGDLANIERSFRALYRNTPAMLHVVDAEGRLLEVSDRWLRKLGYAREEVIGRPILDFLSETTRERLQKGRLTKLFFAQDHTNHPREMLTKSGEVIEVLMSAVAGQEDGGNPYRLYVASKDVTQRNRAERRLRESFEENARLRKALERERDYLREEVELSMNFGHIIGSSPALILLMERIDAVADTRASVLILGESGTGKELVAHAIHSASPRAQQPLVKVNCASIPDDLFESEFFGHVKGAFTGAYKDRVGRFQLAHKGTLFLDEVSEIPLELQGKLLRVLQEKEFERVGDDRTMSVDVRVVAASNKDLASEVRSGRFREDLFYRLSVFPVEVPPLRDRGDDVVQLAVHFLEQICTDFGREPLTLNQGQVEQLRAYRWPGNVRELKNAMERAVILARNGTPRLDLPDATASVSDGVRGDRAQRQDGARPILTDAEFKAAERDNLLAALEQSGWRISGQAGAAVLLGLKPSTLSGRMKAHGIETPRLRRGRPASVLLEK